MRVAFNYDEQHILQVPTLLKKAFGSLPEVELVNLGEEPELVVNSMPFKGIVRGSKKTVYWELDIAEASHPGEYPFVDIVYFPSNMRKDIWRDNCKFLPMAVDFDYYYPLNCTPEHDVIFMGRMDRSLRKEYIEKLSQSLKVLNTTAERGSNTTHLLAKGKCSFQISEFVNLEQRNFEYSAVVPMVLERVPDIKVFTEEEHYKGFDRDDYQEFESQIKWCVENYEKALKMRDRMVKHLKKNHTYVNRARQILEDIC